MLQVIRAAMLFSILIYAFIIKLLPASARPNPITYPVIAFLASWVLAAIFFFRRKLVQSSATILALSPDDPVALRRWRTGYLIIYAFSDAIALYGLVLHFLGFSPAQVIPFFVVAIAPILLITPRRPTTSS
jgi:hypothetical protein